MAKRDPKKNYENVKRWRAANKEKVAAQAKRYAAKHPETSAKAKVKHRALNADRIREMDRVAQAERRKANPEAQRERMLRFKAKREALMVEEAGRPKPDVCEVCGELHIRIVFDHCHAGGHFRGWLCDRCNRTLGLVYDNAELLRKLATYLENDRGKADEQ